VRSLVRTVPPLLAAAALLLGAAPAAGAGALDRRSAHAYALAAHRLALAGAALGLPSR